MYSPGVSLVSRLIRSLQEENSRLRKQLEKNSITEKVLNLTDVSNESVSHTYGGRAAVIIAEAEAKALLAKNQQKTQKAVVAPVAEQSASEKARANLRQRTPAEIQEDITFLERNIRDAKSYLTGDRNFAKHYYGYDRSDDLRRNREINQKEDRIIDQQKELSRLQEELKNALSPK